MPSTTNALPPPINHHFTTTIRRIPTSPPPYSSISSASPIFLSPKHHSSDKPPVHCLRTPTASQKYLRCISMSSSVCRAASVVAVTIKCPLPSNNMFSSNFCALDGWMRQPGERTLGRLGHLVDRKLWPYQMREEKRVDILVSKAVLSGTTLLMTTGNWRM
jgi:hypothetical protein